MIECAHCEWPADLHDDGRCPEPTIEEARDASDYLRGYSHEFWSAAADGRVQAMVNPTTGEYVRRGDRIAARRDPRYVGAVARFQPGGVVVVDGQVLDTEAHRAILAVELVKVNRNKTDISVLPRGSAGLDQR